MRKIKIIKAKAYLKIKKLKLLDNIVWSIIDGKDTCIFDDRWALMQHHPLQKSPGFLENLVMVKQLIRPSSGHWNVDLIKEVFDNVSANAILNTPSTNLPR